MKESVGPVESGDGGALPDFSRFEQDRIGMRIAARLESSQSFPVRPQAVGRLAKLSICALTNRLAAGMEFVPELVGREVPWFMPLFSTS